MKIRYLSHDEAVDMLARMIEIVNNYGRLTEADVKQLSGYRAYPVDYEMGWSSSMVEQFVVKGKKVVGPDSLYFEDMPIDSFVPSISASQILFEARELYKAGAKDFSDENYNIALVQLVAHAFQISMEEAERRILGTPRGSIPVQTSHPCFEVTETAETTDGQSSNPLKTSYVISEHPRPVAKPPTNEHIVLVALHYVGPENMEEAQASAQSDLDYIMGMTESPLESWWVAMDERYYGLSDNDSAEFVPGSGEAAWMKTRIREAEAELERCRKRLEEFSVSVSPMAADGIRESNRSRIGQVRFSSFPVANNVRKLLNEMVDNFGRFTINDVVDLINITPNAYADDRTAQWGYKISQGFIQYVDGAWRLKLPPPSVHQDPTI